MLKILFRGTLTALVLAVLFSCGRGKSDSGGESAATGSAAVQRQKTDVTRSRGRAEDAEAPKFAAALWAEAEEQLAAAEDAIASEEYTDARDRLREAKRTYDRAASEAAKAKPLVAQFEQMKTEVVTLQKQASEAGADKLAAQYFTDAQSKLNEAVASLRDGKSPAAALASLRTARGYFHDALYEAQRRADEVKAQEMKKAEAIEEKKIALEEEKAAQEAGADTRYSAEFKEAQDDLRAGDRAIEQENHEDALLYYRRSKDYFRVLVQRLQFEREEQAASQPVARGPAPGPHTAAGALEPPPETPAWDPRESPAAPSAMGLAGFLELHKDKLFACANVAFEGNKVTLDYSRGDDVRADGESRGGNFKLDFFEPGNRDAPLSFMAGGPRGNLLFKPVFTREVKISCEVQMDLVGTNSPMVLVHAMSNTRGNSYGANFGVYAGMISQLFQFRAARTAYKPALAGRPPSHWYDKTQSHTWDVELVHPEGEKDGTLTVAFDGEKVSQCPVKGVQSGRVGFTWNNCMFTVKNLSIQGILDGKWAVETLQAKNVSVPHEVLVEAGLKAAGDDAGDTGGTSAPKPLTGELDF